MCDFSVFNFTHDHEKSWIDDMQAKEKVILGSGRKVKEMNPLSNPRENQNSAWDRSDHNPQRCMSSKSLVTSIFSDFWTDLCHFYVILVCLFYLFLFFILRIPYGDTILGCISGYNSRDIRAGTMESSPKWFD